MNPRTHKQKYRDDRARLALAFAQNLPDALAKAAVAEMFKVSKTTARHLIVRGKFLAVTDSSLVQQKGS
jgi:hypothetical protein